MFRISGLRALTALCAFTAASLTGQTSRGTLSGSVVDPSGAAIVNAAISLTNLETNVARRSTTNGSGRYAFEAVDPGTYSVSAKATGFGTSQVASFPLTAGQVASVDLKLAVGETTSTVDVSADAAVLQTESPVRGGSIETKAVVDLPVALRNPVSLVLTLPGVTSNRNSNGVATFSVNGSRGRSNNFLIDGTENNDISVAGQGFQIKNPDAVQEVSAQTSNFDSEFGRAGGAVVNVITKSGTNQLHGTASYLLDVTNDDAITSQEALDPVVQAKKKPNPGTDQWFAGTLGGAIIHNRTFFFGSFYEERQNQAGSSTATVPSAAGRAVLNSLFPAGKNKNVDLYNSVTGSINASSQFFLVPLGNGRPDIEFGTGIISYGAPLRDRSETIKIDHRISDNDLLYGRFLFDDQNVSVATVSYPGFNTGQLTRYQNALIAETHIFSPSLTNEFRLPYNRILLDVPLNTANPLGKTLPNYNIAGINTGGVLTLGVATNLPQGRIANNYGLQDTVTWVRGTHSLRAGVDLLDQRSRQFAPIVERGLLDYRAAGAFSGFANFVDDFGGSGPSTGSADRDFGSAAYYPKLFRQAYFAQDRWRVTQGLTVTYGVRYEYFGIPVNTLRTPAYTGLFNIDPVTLTGPFNQPDKVQSDKNNFSPSLGIAYSPSFDSGMLGKVLGNKKSVVRAGYNIGYDSFFNNIASNAATSSPNIISTQVTSTITAANPRGLPNLSALLPAVARALTPADGQGLVVGNLVNPYYQHWSFGVQRQLPGNFIVDASYVGSKGTKLFIQEDLNPAVPLALRITPANVNPNATLTGRLDNLQGQRTIRTNGGSSYYHAGQLSVTRRFNSGLFANFSYTYSKLIDYASDVFTTNNTLASSAVPTVFGGLKREKGVSLFDRTQRAVLTYGYVLPFFREQRGLVGHVLGGFQVTGVSTFEVGVPYTIVNGQDADGIGGSNDRPDANPNGKQGVRAVPSATSPTGYINPDAGNAPIDPATARYIGVAANSGRTGNLGRNTYRTPGIENWDVNVLKTVKLTERFRAEFRTEFYNIFNHYQPGVASPSPFSPAGGTLSGSVFASAAGRFLNTNFLDGGGRVIRYQLKIVF